MINFENYQLGKTDESIQIDTVEDNRLAVTHIAQQSSRTIDIISREFDPPIFDTPDFIDAVKKMVLGSRQSKVRVIVFEPKTIVQRGHRFIDLATHISSYIEIRIPSYIHKDFNETLFIADSTAYVHRLHNDRYEASLNYNDKRVSKILSKEFNDIWSRATPDSNFRRVVM